ncbi:hypothetical protein LIER_05640 [Lithospermum erythrorhizon]|uniref:Uncharacterized protein n=1 Tax=Lithospermum erythrorhizon TaxID=34254 RepID=A0AAV3P1F8_LITER
MKSLELPIQLEKTSPPSSYALITFKVVISYEEFIYVVTFLMIQSLWYLPKELIDDYEVPTVIFKNQLKAFHAFLMAIMVSFTSASLVIFLRERFHKMADYFRKVSILTFVLTLLIIFHAAACHCSSYGTSAA